MELKTELDSLLVAARQTIQLCGEAADRIESLREEILFEETKLRKNKAVATAISVRLSKLALHASLVEPDEAAECMDLESLEAVVTERLATRRSIPPPDNVVFIAPRPQREDSDDQAKIAEQLEDPRSLEEDVRKVLATLTPNEESVVRLRYGIGTDDGWMLEGRELFVQQHVADHLGLTQSSVSRVLNKALRKLRHPSRYRRLLPWFRQIDPASVGSREENLLISVFGWPAE